jgi:3-oxo-5alpha-steroid 4-dehydrogenase
MAARRVPGSLTRAIEQLEERSGRRYTLVARRGVVLATGGFSYNAAMMRTYAPAYAGAMPLGTAGDDGAGIRLGLSVGAATKLMDHCGASRFITPPVAFASGILVDERGERVCDESMYAASLSKAIAKRGGRAWLIVDGAIRDRVRAEMRAQARVRDRPLGEIVRGKANHVAFPLVFGTINLHLNRELSSSLRGLAVRCGIPPDELVRTVQHYNDRVEAGEPDELGKPPELVSVLVQPPFAAIPCHLDSVVFPAPCITLGGLLVDGHTQQVLRADGSAIGGLYAAGRTAAGVASRSYVSGLSLADCVFSGRNAGMALGAAPATVTLDAGPPRRAGVDPPDGR